MENTRQKKISKILQKDIAEIIQQKMKKQGTKGVLVSVTRVDVSVDFSSSKVFLSVFPSAMSQQILKEVSFAANSIKHLVSQKAKNQLRRVPSFVFYIDDSLDYIDKIESSLKGLDNPINKQRK
jgi:ribosome-binding factor A